MESTEQHQHQQQQQQQQHDEDDCRAKLEECENIIQILIESLPNLRQNFNDNDAPTNSAADLNNDTFEVDSAFSHKDTAVYFKFFPYFLIYDCDFSFKLIFFFSYILLLQTVFKLFAKQLITIKKLDRLKYDEIYRNYPNLRKWFSLFCINDKIFAAICSKCDTFYDLFNKSESDLNKFLSTAEFSLNNNQINSICFAFSKLKLICKLVHLI